MWRDVDSWPLFPLKDSGPAPGRWSVAHRSTAVSDPRTDALPPRLLPLLYIGAAHLSLTLAFACAAWRPRALTGFFYHSWMAALVHLVTLGWITMSILGVFYIVGPMALRMSLPAKRGDYVAYALVVIGVVGLVAHFWIEEFGGMAWSAATVTTGVLYVMARVVANLERSAADRPVKLHIALAALNLLGAATMGTLLGFDKVYHFLPGYVLANVFGHAHLAAVGWATMMVVGVGYRLLPMVLPAEMPHGRSMYASAALLETGIAGLFITLLLQSTWARPFGLLIVAGLTSFVTHVITMVHRQKPRPIAAMRPDYAVWHAASAGVCLIIAASLGLVLLFTPASEWRLRAAVAYGVFGLVGFLAQIIVGMEIRILPTYAWYWAYANAGFEGETTSPHAMGDQTLRRLVFYLWTLGVPSLAGGLFFDAVALVGMGASLLLSAMVLAAVNNISVVARVFEVGKLRATRAT